MYGAVGILKDFVFIIAGRNNRRFGRIINSCRYPGTHVLNKCICGIGAAGIRHKFIETSVQRHDMDAGQR